MKLDFHHEILVNEDGQVIIRMSVPAADAAAHGVELTFPTLTLTRAQSAKLADAINAAQGRTK